MTVLSDPEDYKDFLDELQHRDISIATRRRFALKAFEHTAEYDIAISDFFRKRYANEGKQFLSLRYGTNPHQKPASAHVSEGQIPFKSLSGSPGYVNLLDALNAWALVKELSNALGYPAAGK